MEFVPIIQDGDLTCVFRDICFLRLLSLWTANEVVPVKEKNARMVLTILGVNISKGQGIIVAERIRMETILQKAVGEILHHTRLEYSQYQKLVQAVHG